MINLLLIAAGGAAGSVLRYGLQKIWNTSFPFGTLWANIIGCFFIGCLWAISVKGLNEQLRLLLVTGFCGGFTTFSAFSAEGIQMLMTGKWLLFFLYIMASVAGGLLAAFWGYKIFS